METFFELVADFFITANSDMVKSKGHKPWQLNVFVDMKTEKLVLQYACRDGKGEHVAKETLPSMDDFKIFKGAFNQVKQGMKDEGQRVEFSDVIFLMEHLVVNELAQYGYDKNIHFSISYIPLD